MYIEAERERRKKNRQQQGMNTNTQSKRVTMKKRNNEEKGMKQQHILTADCLCIRMCVYVEVVCMFGAGDKYITNNFPSI